MKCSIVSIIILLACLPCTAQWKGVEGDTTGENGMPVALGVHDTSLFISQTTFGSNRVFRYAGPGLGIFADNGIDHSQGDITSFASVGSYFFAGTTHTNNGTNGPVYCSTNDGSRWTDANVGGPIGTNGTYVFGTYVGPSQIVRSKNNGNTWDSITNLSVSRYAANGAYIFAITSDGVWRSRDSGGSGTWAIISYPLNPPRTIAVLGTYLFGASSAPPAGITRSTDSGTSWTVLNDTLVANDLAVSGSYLFAGTNRGVWISSDSGAHWRDVSDGLGSIGIDNRRNANILCVFDSMLFAGIYLYTGVGYVAARPISEMVSESKSAVQQPVALRDTIAIYPNPATGVVTILVGGGYAAIERVSVLSVLGVEVLTLDKPGGMSHNSEITLDLSHLPSGTYFLRIQTASSTVLRKVVRE